MQEERWLCSQVGQGTPNNDEQNYEHERLLQVQFTKKIYPHQDGD